MNATDAPAFEPPASALLRGGAEAASEPGPSLRDLLDLLEARGVGAALLLLGLILLIPLKWVLPQIAGLLVLFLGWRLISGPHTLPMLGVLSKRPVSKARLEGLAGMAKLVEGVIHPRLLDFSTGPGERAAGWAVLLLGVCIALPIAHFWPALALILIGLGLVQRDGLIVLPGFFIAVCCVAFVATMFVGAALGAEFGVGWLREQGAWTAPLLPKPPAS